MTLRPCPHVSGYFRIRNFFFPDTATVHTYPANSTANPEKKSKSALQIACERRRIFSVTGSAENNVCEPVLENDFSDVGILSQSQFSSEKPRTTARGIRVRSIKFNNNGG